MSENYETFEFIAEAAGERLDKALAGRLKDLSRVQIQHLIREGLVTINGAATKASYRIVGGETVVVRVPMENDPGAPQPEDIPLTVLYEDAQLAVIDKPAGIVVHPSYGHKSGTLVNAILARWPQTADFGAVDRAGIVHRLDKDTSGVILVAKTAGVLDHLRAQFKARTVTKRYLALVEGMPKTPEGIVDAPVGRDPNQRKRMAVTRAGREAVTEFRVLETYAYYSLVEIFLKTGRTHQIRVHMAFIGHPVAGDTVYGRRKQRIKMKRHFLHAAQITCVLPDSGEALTVEAPLPVPLQDVLNKLAQ